MALALAGASLTVAPVAAVQQASGGLLLTGRAAADFRIPADVRLTGSRSDRRHGLNNDRYQQYASGPEALVEGAQLTVVRRGQEQVLVIGAHYANLATAGGPLIGAAGAIARVASGARLTESVPREVIGLLRRRTELRLDPLIGRLFFRVESRAPGVRQFHDVDAQTGAIMAAWNALDDVDGMGTGAKLDRKSLLGGNVLDPADDLTSADGFGVWRMRSTNGDFLTLDARNGWTYPSGLGVMADNTVAGWANDNDWQAPSQRAAVDAQYYAALTDAFYKDRFGYDLLADCGLGALRSVVHYRSGYDNAFWDGQYMVYGDGDGLTTRSYSGGQDVVTHELTHAVTECRANLEYQDEPGALNEAFSDIMASAAEWAADEPVASNCHREPGQAVCPDWWEGEDLIIGGSTFGFRSLADPALADQPSHYDSYMYRGSNWDNGGVHFNSGIVNHAFYLMVNGGRNARCSGPTDAQADCDVLVPAIGMAHAEQIMFAAFGGPLLTENADFCAVRRATIAAADLLYPDSAADHAAAELAWAAVGRSAADCEAWSDFSIQPASRSIALAPGASADLLLSLHRGFGNTDPISFDVSDPAPSSASFAPQQSQVGVPPDDGTLVTFTVPVDAASGIYPVVFSATDGATTQHASAVLVVDAEPPELAVTGTLIMPGGTISTGGVVPLQVSWTASDGASGLAAAQLEHSPNGVDWTVIPGGSPGGATLFGAASGAHQFRALGSDGAGNAASSDPATLTLTGYHDPAAIYSRGWSRYTAPTAWGSTRYSKTRGASATFVFSGTDVAWVASRGPKRGKAKVYLDGQLVTRVDLYAPSLSERRIVFTAADLAAGQHTLRIVVSGTSGRPRVDIDGFVVLS